MTLYSAQAPVDGDTRSNSGTGEEVVESSWLADARNAFNASTDYYDSEMRKQIEKSLAHFNGRHPAGSKYHSAAYRFRSKGFRPKTRSVIRRNEAAAATALFSTQDIVDMQPELEGDKAQVVSAEILRELIGYRLEKSLPWFRIAIGAYQDALTTGVAISHQFWDYEERLIPEVMLDEFGEPMVDEEGNMLPSFRPELLRDQPNIEMRPIENVRFSPAANWLDPLNDSPYVIDMIPMYVGDVKQRMIPSGKRMPWHSLSDTILASGMASFEDRVGRGRDRTSTNKEEVRHNVADFDVVWVHRNIMRRNGVDYIFYTLGTIAMLSDPVQLEEEYIHLKPGQRPYVMGSAILETNRAYPSGLAELMAPLQQEANDINNQRRDNVALVLNRRYLARRGAAIDYKSLTRNVPGSVTLVENINTDIKVEAPPEVTGSSYQEQDRVNMDYDELAGSFSTSSVGTNRQLNETVGGMSMLSDGANAIVEYQLRCFVETWVEPVLRQLIQLEQAYETDETVLAVAGERSKVMQRYGIDRITDRMLQGSMTVRVNVGFGATSPQKRLEKISMGLRTIGEIMPERLQSMNQDEVIKEVFGALGFRSSERFFPVEDEQNPEVAQLQQQLQQAMQALESQQAEAQAKAQVDMARVEVQRDKNMVDSEIAQARMMLDRELRMMDMALKRDLTLAQLRAKLEVDSQNAYLSEVQAAQKAQIEERTAAIKLMEQNTKRLQAQNSANELQYKATTGNEGI